MATSIADLVADALTLIENGQLTLSEATTRYGEHWSEMRPFVETALRINQASHPPLVSQRPFTPLDKAAGWQQLRTQIGQDQAQTLRSQTLHKAKVPAQPKPTRTFAAWLDLFFGTTWGRVATGALMTVAFTFILTFAIANALPGDPFYRAKLGWDYMGEVASLSPDARAIASMRYADNRLGELERLVVGGRSEQVNEAQGQYLRALDAGLSYATTPGFNSVGSVFTRLDEQRTRLIGLQRYEYALGTRSQLTNILGRLDYTANLIAGSRGGPIPTATPVPTPVPLPPTPTKP